MLKFLVLLLPMTAFASESLAGKLALIRERHPTVTAVQLADVVKVYGRDQVRRVYAAPPIVDTGVDFARPATGPADGTATHVAGIVADDTARLSDLAGRVREKHPELTAAEIVDIFRMLN